MKTFSRIAQPITWILFTYSACLVNFRSTDLAPIFTTLGLLVAAIFFTWRSYHKS